MAHDFLSNLLTCGPGAAERFLTDWYGAPARGRVETRATSEGPYPSPLRRLHELVAGRPAAIVQNQLLAPPRLHNDRLVFYVENQGVYEWATEASAGNDARVWGREPDETEWTEEEPTLSAFIIELLVFEAIMASTHGASVAWLPAERISDALDALEPFPFGSWRWPDYPTRFYAGSDRQLAVVMPNRVPSDPRDDVSVLIAAQDSPALAYLDSIVDESWDHFSRRESSPL